MGGIVCGPQELVGPFDHTLFLGCSISSVSITVGMNEQVTQATVVLVEDPCPALESSPKYYYDSLLEEQTWLGPDPGFFGEFLDIVGCPVFLRLAQFEFSGIVQSWENNNSDSGNTYTVKLTVPTEILQGTQLIIGDYSGGIISLNTESVYNMINVFGFAESYGISAPARSYDDSGGSIDYTFGNDGPDGATFGSLTSYPFDTGDGKFGGADRNANGMKWSVIFNAFSTLVNNVTPMTGNMFNPYGRIVYNGVTLSGAASIGCGLLGLDATISNNDPTPDRKVSFYVVDLTELLDMGVPSSYRFNGTSISLLELISNLTSESGHDYYLELLYVKPTVENPFSGLPLKVIKVRTISRLTQPNPVFVKQFIDQARTNELLISSSYGKELRNEQMASFIIGANKQTIYQADRNTNSSDIGDDDITSDDIILPYFGTELNGGYILPTRDRETPFSNTDLGDTEGQFEWTIQPDVTLLNNSLSVLAFPSNPVIGLTEMLAARLSYDLWYMYATIDTNWYTDCAQVIADGESAPFLFANKLVDKINRGKSPASRDAFNINESVLGDYGEATHQKINEDIRKIHEWVASFGEYIGREFMVRVPSTSIQVDSESGAIQYSELPTNDGGWTDQPTVLGLANPGYAVDFFSDDTGKIHPFVRALDDATLLDLSYFSPDDYITIEDGPNMYVFIKAQVDEGYIYQDPTAATPTNPRVHIVVADCLTLKSEEDQAQFDALSGIERAIRSTTNIEPATVASIREHIGSRSLNEPGFKYPAKIEMAAIPMKSTVLTYGPWFNTGPPGQVKIEKNDGLAPWEFGGYINMNAAGQELANAGVTEQQVGEVGQVSIIGYPILPLGAEIMSAVDAEINSVDTRIIETFDFTFGVPRETWTLPTEPWEGASGPNITGISVEIGDGGVTTNYQLRTFTQYPGRFAKLNADRLKQVGQQRVQMERRIRKLNVFNNFSANQSARGKASRLREREKHVSRAVTAQTPHEVFVGEIYAYDSGHQRTLIASESMGDLLNEINSGYRNKSIMSLDGLIRPISIDGGDNLGSGTGDHPRFIVPLSGKSQKNSSIGSIGPIQLVKDGDIFYGGGYDDDRINQNDLNPFTNPVGFRRSDLNQNKQENGLVGHDIDILGRYGSGYFDNPESLIMITGDEPDYADDYRPLALRGPLVIHGWGYDIDGKPVPNENDDEDNAASGIFTTGDLSDRFLEGWLRKPITWPVAPVDLRLDRERGVWVSPQPKDHMVVELTENIGANSSGYGTLILRDEDRFYKNNGDPIEGSIGVTIHELLGNNHSQGDKLVVRYHERNGRWEIMGGGGGANIKVVLIDADISGSTENDDILETSEITKPSGYTVIFQDPADDNYDNNQVDNLNLWPYQRYKVNLKYYDPAGTYGGTAVSTGPNTVFLDDGASDIEDYYAGHTIEILTGSGAGQVRTILSYEETVKYVTVTENFSPEIEDNCEYLITGPQKLAYTTIDDDDNERTIVRYATTDVWYDDGKPFLVGEYKRSDYPNYDENTTFPPDNLPSGFLNKRYRGIVINDVLITALCKPLPAPELPE